METDETRLIDKACRGDMDAFAGLVALHERFVFNLALRTLGNQEDAADLAQEAFVRAWQGLAGFRQQSSLRTWLYRIVLNLCLNRLPRLRRQLNELSQDEILEMPGPDSALSDPAFCFEQDQRRRLLHHEIDGLPETYRLLVSLRYQDDLSYEEIAGLTHLPVSSVKTGLFRAKERLRRALEPAQEELR